MPSLVEESVLEDDLLFLIHECLSDKVLQNLA